MWIAKCLCCVQFLQIGAGFETPFPGSKDEPLELRPRLQQRKLILAEKYLEKKTQSRTESPRKQPDRKNHQKKKKKLNFPQFLFFLCFFVGVLFFVFYCCVFVFFFFWFSGLFFVCSGFVL